ncbi:MAG: acetyl/propionyl/methylcrotonyl-CoA carboxylase subunit alpha [Acidimicrobiales bacterium]
MTFSSLLVANRGEIARRILRAARAAGLRTVAVYVEADENAPFLREADEAVLLPSSYLDASAIVAAALNSGAESIHPGYGFLSENASFATDVLSAGLVWVGPPPKVIADVGDKLAAKAFALVAGVPVLASSENLRDAKSIGYPLMVKAAAGGGGKGMRVVNSPSDLTESLEAARREAQAGFSDDRVFLERYIARSRHVEVQILGDRHGHLVHLGERECSIQRRHQKLIEESPSPALDESTRDSIQGAALALARAIGYESAGTVEFLVDDDTRDFYFLEVNARLQVEHPVTEAVSGIDIVREQLRLAQGEELGYSQEDVVLRGHAIEVRLCAEDPLVGFLPATGTLNAFDPPSEPALRWENGVERGSRVTVNFDPLLAKVISRASTRDLAAAELALGLERLHLGGVTTNRDFLVNTLRDDHFLRAETTTDFIERFDPPRALDLDDIELTAAACAGALWLQGRHRADASVLADVPSGWRNARLPRQHVELLYDERSIHVNYVRRRDGTFDLGEFGRARVHEWSPDLIDVEIDTRRRRARVTYVSGHLYLQVLRGTIDFDVVQRFKVRGHTVAAGGLSAPMPGRILDVRVSPGQLVHAGETLIVIEAMKMEHTVAASREGVVDDVLVAKGEQVERGATLLTMHDGSASDVRA